MTIHLEIPDDLAQRLSTAGKDISHVAYELMLAEAYREEILTHEEVRQAMGYQTPWKWTAFSRSIKCGSSTPLRTMNGKSKAAGSCEKSVGKN